MSRQVRFGSVLILVVALVAVPGPAAAESDQELSVRTSLSLTPDRPGAVGVTVEVSVPDGVSSVSLRGPEGATVESWGEFDREGERTYRWKRGQIDRESRTLTLVLSVRANRTTANGQLFADTGSWAYVRRPRVGVDYETGALATESVTVSRETTVAGQGAIGQSTLFLGPHHEYTERVGNQTVRLVVPEAATLAEPPAEILQSMTDAARRFDVGGADPSVFVVATPTSVAWARPGAQYGGSDARVQASARLDTPNNLWIHEYAHTRQTVEPGPNATWLREATAEYYAARFALEQGRVTVDKYRDHLALGRREPVADAVLADPATWEGPADYWKGALVLATVDHAIRRDTDDSRHLLDVIAHLNRHRIYTDRVFHEAVSRQGSRRTAALLERYTETSAVPPLPEVEDGNGSEPTAVGFRVEGPYRNRSVEGVPTLVADERLAVDGPVPPNVTIVDATTHPLLQPATREQRTARRTVYAFSRPGEYVLRAAGQQLEVRVRRPAPLYVRSVELSGPSDAGRATVHVTAANPAVRPARGTIRVVHGEQHTVRTVRLAPGDRTRLSTTIRADGPLALERAGPTVRVVDAHSTPTDRPEPASPDPPRDVATDDPPTRPQIVAADPGAPSSTTDRSTPSTSAEGRVQAAAAALSRATIARIVGVLLLGAAGLAVSRRRG